MACLPTAQRLSDYCYAFSPLVLYLPSAFLSGCSTEKIPRNQSKLRTLWRLGSELLYYLQESEDRSRTWLRIEIRLKVGGATNLTRLNPARILRELGISPPTSKKGLSEVLADAIAVKERVERLGLERGPDAVKPSNERVGAVLMFMASLGLYMPQWTGYLVAFRRIQPTDLPQPAEPDEEPVIKCEKSLSILLSHACLLATSRGNYYCLNNETGARLGAKTTTSEAIIHAVKKLKDQWQKIKLVKELSRADKAYINQNWRLMTRFSPSTAPRARRRRLMFQYAGDNRVSSPRPTQANGSPAPRRPRHRNQSLQGPVPGGLINPGATCYANVIIQVFRHVSTYKELLAGLESGAPALLRQLSLLTGTDTANFMRSVYDLPGFQEGRQQDAHELLLNVESMIIDHTSSPKHLQGEITVKRGCSSCEHTWATRETMGTFSIDVPAMRSASFDLQNSLCFQEEEVEVTCPSCGHNRALCRQEITRVPRLLRLHLKRFSFSARGRPIKHQAVALVPRQLQLGAYRGSLAAVVVHEGPRADRGHYVCFIRAHDNWWRCDDEAVTREDERSVLACCAYLCFYEEAGEL